MARPRRKTPAEIAAEQVERILAPLIAEREEQAARQSEGYGRIYSGLAEAQTPIGDAIEETYRKFGGDNSALARGYSDGMRAILGDKAAEANVALALQGSPQTVESGSGAADVLFGTRGSIPSQAINREGAAFTSVARLLPGQARALGAQQQAGALQRGRDEIAQLQGKRPELVQQALDAILDRLQQQRSLNIQERYLLNTQRRTGAEITGFDPITGLPTADVAAAGARTAAQKAAAQRTSVGKRNEATATALADAADWLEEQLKPGTQLVESGRVPVKIGDKKVGKVSVPIYAKQGGGTTTDPNLAVTKQVFEQVPLPRAEYQKLRRKVISRLRRELGRFGYKPHRLSEFADDLLTDYFTFSEQFPPTPGLEPPSGDRRSGR